MIGWQGLQSAALDLMRVIVWESLYVIPIFCVVAAASWAFRRRGPGLHCALWSLVLIRLVLPLDLGHPIAATRLLDRLVSAVAPSDVAIESRGGSAGFVPSPATVTNSTGSRPGVPWALIGALTWAVGSLVVGRRMWLGRSRFQRLARTARDPRTTDLVSLAEGWRRRLGVRRHVRIAVTDASVSPFTIGILRPVIVLPEALALKSKRRVCEAAIAHEMAHVRLLDALWADAQRLLHCLYFFHPLVWYAGSRIDLERERLCDATVLRYGDIGRRSYAGALIEVVGLGLATGSVPAFTQPRRRVHMRIQSIVQHRTASITGRCAAACVVFVLGAVFLPLAGETETAAAVGTTNTLIPPAPAVAPLAPVSAAAVPQPAPAPAPASAPASVPKPAPLAMADPVPESRVTQGWGDARHPFSGDVVFHKGFDLAAPRGTGVRAAADGVVSRLLVDYEGKDTGRFVIIDHGEGLTSYYGHLDEILVAAGDAVDRGQTIATVGMTGLTTGPHIHFEVRRDGERLDPGLFVEK